MDELSLLAYLTWKKLFDRTVSQKTTDQIWQGVSDFLNVEKKYTKYYTVDDVIKHLAPTDDEIAPLAESFYLEDKDTPMLKDVDYYWYEAVKILKLDRLDKAKS